MKSHEIRQKTLEDVTNDLLAAQENLRTIKFQMVTGQLENTSLLTKAKRDVARLRTAISEHEKGIFVLGAQATAAQEGETK